MKRVFIKFAAIALSLVLMLTMFSACGKSAEEEPSIDAIVDAAVKAAVDAAVVHTTLTIEADGQEIAFEDTDAKSIQMLLDQANITLNEGDMLFIDPNQMLSGEVSIKVVRKCAVTIVVTAEETEDNTQFSAVLMGGTVADAIAAVGVELAENQVANFELDQALENGMEIIISEKIEEEVVEETEATEPEATSSSSSYSSSSSSSYTPSYSGSSSSSSSSGSSYTPAPAPAPTAPPATEPPATEPPTTAPPATEPPTTAPSKTVVSVEIYEDCDGSGHGVKVITYSDGTQEEVPF